MVDGPDSTTRRTFLAATGAAVVAGSAGCSGLLGGGGGMAVRFDEESWQSVDPVATGENHRQFYHGSDDRSPPDEQAVHDYVASNTATFLVHRNESEGADPPDALVLTYDAPDDSDGQATVSFDEPVDTEADLVVVDGTEGEGANPDEYDSEEFFHQWAQNFTDGVVISTEPFSKPTFQFSDVEGLDTVRVLTATEDGTDEYTTTPDADVQFRF